MFKRIELWVALLLVFFTFLFGIVLAIAVRQELVGTTKVPLFSGWPLWIAEMPSNLARLYRSDLLAEFSPGDQRGFEGTGVESKSFLLLSRYDGDKEESVVELVDLTTLKVEHQWNPNVNEILGLVDSSNPEFGNLIRDRNETRFRITHPLMDENGNLYFKHTSPLISIDWCSNLRWINQDYTYHHSLEFDEQGNIWVPTQTRSYQIDQKYVNKKRSKPLNDGVAKLNRTGELIFQRNLLDLMMSSGSSVFNLYMGGYFFGDDPIHLNDVQPVKNNGKAWKKGDLLLSMASQRAIVNYRPTEDVFVWSVKGPWFYQHDVNVVDENTLSVFNNNWVNEGHAEMILFDPLSNEFEQYFRKWLVEADVKTQFGGRGRILEDGSLFIEEQDRGRIFFFSASGLLKWSYRNTNSNGDAFRLSWSRIVDDEKNIQAIETLLSTKSC